jgi:hypothetical protein
LTERYYGSMLLSSRITLEDRMDVLDTKDIACKSCLSIFTSKKINGKWPVFCTNKCRLASYLKPQYKPCGFCLATFLAKKSSHSNNLKTFCSAKCRSESLKKGGTEICAQCGIDYYLSSSKKRESQRSDRFCSAKCRFAYCTGTKSPVWKGGIYQLENGQRFVQRKRIGYSSHMVGTHRLIAGEAIGRPLIRGEVVIRVNNDKSDDRPVNLFICKTNSEFSRRRNGSLPWPTESNLDTYK